MKQPLDLVLLAGFKYFLIPLQVILITNLSTKLNNSFTCLSQRLYDVCVLLAPKKEREEDYLSKLILLKTFNIVKKLKIRNRPSEN